MSRVYKSLKPRSGIIYTGPPSINRQNGETYRQVANYRYSPEFNKFMALNPIPSGRWFDR